MFVGLEREGVMLLGIFVFKFDDKGCIVFLVKFVDDFFGGVVMVCG